MNYPNEHLEIVKSLLDGKFILQSDESQLYDVISNQFEEYEVFFGKSFNYELIQTSEFIYLASEGSAEKFSRDLMILLAILVYEYNAQGQNFYTHIKKRHSIESIKENIDNSSYKSMCRKIDIDKLLLNDCKKRNIIKEHGEGDFSFTSAINLFLNFARENYQVVNME
jgi:hypothetical protein